LIHFPHEIWEVSGRKRVLAKGLDFKQQVLLLLYGSTEAGIAIEDLFTWTEYSHFAMFKRSVITQLHSQRLIEYDREIETAIISPSGIPEVEDVLLPKLDS
jgi:hypothetical protein